MSIELPKPPTPFDYAYKFTSPFGGEVWRMSSSAWNGNRPLDSTALFTADQLRAYGQEAARLALEAAAKAVRAQKSTLSMHVSSRECIAYNNAVEDCNNAIRALAAHGAGKVD